MKGKSKDEQKKAMDALESNLNGKAADLETVTKKVSSKQQKLDEEYVLGLLNMHRNDWNMTQQLNATATFMHGSPTLQELYKHHDSSKPLAMQLATLLDKME